MSSTGKALGKAPDKVAASSRYAANVLGLAIQPVPIWSTKMRAGTPFLLDLPLYSSDRGIVERINATHGPKIEESTWSILNKYGIRENFHNDVAIVNRFEPQAPDNQHTTVLITAEWDNDKSAVLWPTIIAEVKQEVDTILDVPDFDNIRITIEMVAPQLCWPFKVDAVKGRPDLDHAWPAIREGVSKWLDNDADIQGRWNCILLLCIGHGLAQENPATVYIGVERACPVLSFSSITNSLQKFISRSYKCDLEVLIEHKEITSLAFERRTPNREKEHLYIKGPYQQRANLGADIGVSSYLDCKDGESKGNLIGTLGCYIEIQTQDTNAWTRFALTNYHVVRPAFKGLASKKSEGLIDPQLDSELATMDLAGFGSVDANHAPAMESPSRAKHNNTVYIDKRRSETMRKGKVRNELESERQKKVEFFDNNKHILGGLFAGSGFARRTPENGLLDWALVEVHKDRQGENALPKTGQLGQPLDTPDYLDPNPLVGYNARLESVTQAFMYGAISGSKEGRYFQHKSKCKISEAKYLGLPATTEVCFLSKTSSGFAAPGDSGAIVYNEDGRVYGIITSGVTPGHVNEGREKVVFVTPIADVLEDIKKMMASRGTIVTGIRIARKRQN